MSDTIVTCDGCDTCAWWTRVPSYEGAASSAAFRLAHHLMEFHGRTEGQAEREALDALQEATR